MSNLEKLKQKLQERIAHTKEKVVSSEIKSDAKTASKLMDAYSIMMDITKMEYMEAFLEDLEFYGTQDMGVTDILGLLIDTDRSLEGNVYLASKRESAIVACSYMVSDAYGSLEVDMDWLLAAFYRKVGLD